MARKDNRGRNLRTGERQREISRTDKGKLHSNVGYSRER